MIRHAAAVAVALCLSPSLLYAQSTQFLVNVPLANVRQDPSTSSPIIGKAPRGTVLKVTGELGRWVRVSWPTALDGAGYMHVSLGLIERKSATAPDVLARLRSGQTTSQRASPTTTRRPGSPPAVYIAPPTHIVGLGGRIGGSTFGMGATARRWTRNRLGIQLEVSRSALTSATGLGRLTSTQFAPSLLYSLRDRVTDHVVVRPYFGTGANIDHSTLIDETSGLGVSASDNGLGFQTFGGAELSFASVAKFALSADVGYRWSRMPFAGFELGGLGLTLSGHWYFK